MSMPQTDLDVPAPATPPKRGRKLGSRNKAGHKAGRPRKYPKEEFAPSVWEHGKAEISVLEKHFEEAMAKNSSHCAIAFAIRDAIPDARHIAVDLQTTRWTNPKRGVRYCFLTPAVAQHSVIIPFDQGDREACKPVTFRMKPAFITRSGARRNHTPEPEQLRGTGLKVADEQPHISGNNSAADRASPEAVREFVGALTGEPVPEPPDWQERHRAASAMVVNGGEVEAPKKRKPRVARAKVSATKPDGSIPVTLGGKLPPHSVLARREWGLRAIRK
jgi:hypothetical protein